MEGINYLAVSALGITLLTALAAGGVGLFAGWLLWKRPCDVCEEQLLRARGQLGDIDVLERENETLRQKVTELTSRLEQPSGSGATPGEPWDPADDAPSGSSPGPDTLPA
jgi:hypothetical protein